MAIDQAKNSLMGSPMKRWSPLDNTDPTKKKAGDSSYHQQGDSGKFQSWKTGGPNNRTVQSTLSGKKALDYDRAREAHEASERTHKQKIAKQRGNVNSATPGSPRDRHLSKLAAEERKKNIKQTGKSGYGPSGRYKGRKSY